MTKAYLLQGERYLRYDFAADAVDTGFPVRIGEFWPGFEAAGFGPRLDAVWLELT